MQNKDDDVSRMDRQCDVTDARTASAVAPNSTREPCWQCEGQQFDGFICGFCGRRHHVAADGILWSSWEPWGVLRIDEDERREPTPKDFADPRFEVIWVLIRKLDVDFDNGLRSGATGNDVAAILDRLDAAIAKAPPGVSGVPQAPEQEK